MNKNFGYLLLTTLAIFGSFAYVDHERVGVQKIEATIRLNILNETIEAARPQTPQPPQHTAPASRPNDGLGRL